MNTMVLGKPVLMVAVLGAALVGCDASGGGNGSAGTVVQGKTLSAAERFVATNTKANKAMNLVALKYLNNGTEVVMFYEPSPGSVMFSVGGSPVGSSMLNHTIIEGKTASQLWNLVSPGESLPDALAQAIERSRNPASVAQAPTADEAPQSPALAIERNTNPADAQAGGGLVNAQAAAVQPSEKLLSGGYCSNGGFWTDWGNLGNGAEFRHVSEQNWGWEQDGAWNNWSFTGHAQFAACPTGSASNTGGWLELTPPHVGTQSWHLDPDFFMVTGWVLPATDLNNGTFNNGDFNCGNDVCCGYNFFTAPFGTPRCTPTGSIANGKFESDCFLNYGGSCGDLFDWIAYATGNGPSYCQQGNGSCPCSAPNDCTGA